MKKISPLLVLLAFIAFSRIQAQNFNNGFSFTLPPFDSSTQVFLPAFPMHNINTYVSTSPTGNFLSGNEEIRFWGVNLTTGGNFPEQSEASLVAARMRKMGINLVRLHHMDNPWTSSNGSIFLQNGSTTSLNPTTLDKLHYFIAQLKSEGIYVDVNLHVSRTFTENDGVLYADSIGGFAKVVNFFDGQLIDLQKQYAQQLLGAVNPYTGLSLANDPVVAMVEITNENTLYGYWKENYLQAFSNGGNILSRHADTLDLKWNNFLLNKYGTQSNLEAAWNGNNAAPAPEMVTDGDFEVGDLNQNWLLELHETSQATMTATTNAPHSGNYCAQIDVTQVTGTDWHIQFEQNGASLEVDSTYTVRFFAKADAPRAFSVSCMRNASPWTWYGGTWGQLTTNWQEYQFSFTAPENNTNLLRLAFVLGQETGTVWLDDVRMSLSRQTALEDGEDLALGNIRRIRYSERQSFTEQRVTDMAEFYLELQKDFYDEMADYLRNVIGVQVPITGSNALGGPYEPYTHQGMDYIDDHAYWNHPVFPNDAWSPWDWYTDNQSMLADDYLGVIPDIFGGLQVADKPYTISEYNHPYPNIYQVEMLPILTGYGSFHGADAFMFFEYNGGDPADWTTDLQNSFFELHRNTPIMALFPLFSYAFRNNYIQEDPNPILIQYSQDYIYHLPQEDDKYRWETYFPYEQRAGLSSSIKIAGFDFPQANIPTLQAGSSPFTTANNQIYFSPQSQLFSIQSEKFECIAGQLSNAPSLTNRQMEITQGEEHGVVAWLSLTDEPLSVSQKSIIAIGSRVQNQNMIWDGNNTVHDDWGNPPTEVKPLHTILSLDILADSLRIFPLGTSGEKIDSFSLYPQNSGKFLLDIDQNNLHSLWFGVEILGTVSSNIQVETDAIRIFPSPVHSILNITGNLSDCSIQVLDAAGQVIDDYTGKNSPIRIDVSNLETGVYFVVIKSNSHENLMVKKIIKQ